MAMSRAMHCVKYDATQLTQVKILGAIEAGDWVVLYHLCERLKEIAERGMYHAAQEKLAEVNAFAMRNHQSEPEAR